MLKDILDVIIVVIIVSFVWRLLKRLFVGSVVKNFQQKNPQNNPSADQPQEPHITNRVHWDAETVDYEEVKEPNNKSN
ncbi:hypothetical protein [Halpernia frigidisoli]|uniref:Uncharacterized protein n=1 Tax=Halpernia frigidisoli TaxID=1125876 RepID=A0A1I3FGI5_9FLAO|nr:hypothetical protein [Halpernia frigidisoli]SFI10325.1 hypothetical protein SAMN05443292_1370 [Halpernia frigidisoli]